EPKPPRKRRNGAIIFLLITFFLILLAVLFIQSDLSKVSQIEINGNRYTASEELGQALVLSVDDPFFSVTAATLSRRLEELPFVEKAVVKKLFPGHIEIEIAEFPEVAYAL